MVVALDSSVAIDFLIGNQKVKNIILSFTDIYLPVTVCGELLFGSVNATDKEKNLNKTREFIGFCKILNCNNIVAEQYAIIRNELKKKGTPIPENDIWIAALCSVNNIPLFTYDLHFSNIEETYLQLFKNSI